MTRTVKWPVVPEGYVYRDPYGSQMAVMKYERLGPSKTFSQRDFDFIHVSKDRLEEEFYPAWLAEQTDESLVKGTFTDD